MTLKEFKKWLNKLVVDKKGALPDLADWKQIKENLDKVKPEVIDTSGYSILERREVTSNGDEIRISGTSKQFATMVSPGCPVTVGGDEYHTVSADECDYDGLCFLGYDMNLIADLEYFRDNVEVLVALPPEYMLEVTYNDIKINLDELNEYKAEEIESILNRGCSGK